MKAVELIEKKRNSRKLNKKELTFFVNGFLEGVIPNYQMSAFLMAVTINGFSDQEAKVFTDVLIKSGRQLSFGEKLVDKHSTGGVGDKTTLIIAPIAAALGMKMVKMSGRGLGHTGGTADKLAAIKGMQLILSPAEIKKSLEEIGVCLLQQSADIAPADKLIYQLRDVTATTNSIPLIASSIMSKKVASGSKILVIDIKVGRGAFIKTKKQGLELARLLKKIGRHYRLKVICVLSRMDEPLGINVGNGLEVMEALSFLNGNYDKKLYDLVMELTSQLLKQERKVSYQVACQQIEEVLNNGKALNSFFEIIENQGGEVRNIKISKQTLLINSPKSGFVKKIDAFKIGKLVQQLGAGRLEVNDEISLGVGVVLHKKEGDYIKKGDPLLKVYFDNIKPASKEFLSCYQFSVQKVKEKKVVIAIV